MNSSGYWKNFGRNVVLVRLTEQSVVLTARAILNREFTLPLALPQNHVDSRSRCCMISLINGTRSLRRHTNGVSGGDKSPLQRRDTEGSVRSQKARRTRRRSRWLLGDPFR